MPLSRDTLKTITCLTVFVVGVVAWVSAATYALASVEWHKFYVRSAEANPTVLVAKGVYRCWQSNRGSRGQTCADAPLVLSAGNRYELGDEQGVFTLENSRLTLSVSKRAGEVQDNGEIILLENGSGEPATVYLRQLQESVQGRK